LWQRRQKVYGTDDDSHFVFLVSFALSSSSNDCPYSLTLALSTGYNLENICELINRENVISNMPHHLWYKYMTKMISSRKQANRWAVGIVMMKAKTSSMKVLKALYMKALHGRCATDLSCMGRERNHQGFINGGN
jgi:hypothetical protein